MIIHPCKKKFICMNNQNPNQKKPDVNKTFVEGDDATTGVHSLSTKSKIDATRIRDANPYENVNTSILPSGSEPIALGSGTIVGLLGSGGMARVYKIWNEKLEVFRAVKILIPGQQGDLRNRFETEAKITAKLHHPNIVEIYNVGDWEGLPYLEMELIDGQSLEAIIGKVGKLPPAVCSAISVFVIRALAYAHGQEFLIYGKTYQGIIHRDLKPANIMISHTGDLKLMDFGIARPTEASLHTVDGNIVGTMQYLSPEQMDGVDVDNRADIYAFGAILYEMLTGTKTFPQETITNLMKQKIMNEYRKFDDFHFSIPSGLAKISQKCLQLAKENRFSSAAMLLKELETVHRTFSSDAPEVILKSFISDPTSVTAETRGKVRLKIKPKIAIPAVGILLVAGCIAVFLLTGPPPSPLPPEKTATPPTGQTVKPPPADAQQQTTPQQQTMQETGVLRPIEPTGAEGKPPIRQAAVENTPRGGAVSQKQRKGHSQTTQPVGGGQRTVRETGVGKTSNMTIVKEDLSPLAKLEKAYESNDYFAIGKLAIQKSEFSDAIVALTAIDRNHPNYEKAALMLMNAYIETGRLKDAHAISQNEKINDGEFYFLSGKLLQKQGRNKEALDFFQTALTKPCAIRNTNDVRNDALYFTALAYRDIYVNDPSADNRGLALQSWLVVKNVYRNNPNHPRFKKATEEMGNIR